MVFERSLEKAVRMVCHFENESEYMGWIEGRLEIQIELGRRGPGGCLRLVDFNGE